MLLGIFLHTRNKFSLILVEGRYHHISLLLIHLNAVSNYFRQQFLYFLPLPQRQRAFLPILVFEACIVLSEMDC